MGAPRQTWVARHQRAVGLVACAAAVVVAHSPARAAEADREVVAPLGGPSPEQRRMIVEHLQPLCAQGDSNACHELVAVLAAIAEQPQGDYHDTLGLIEELSALGEPDVCGLAREVGARLLLAPKGSAPRESEARGYLGNVCVQCRNASCDDYRRAFGAELPMLGRGYRVGGRALMAGGAVVVAAGGAVMALRLAGDHSRALSLVGYGVGVLLFAWGEWLLERGIALGSLDGDIGRPVSPWFWAGLAGECAMAALFDRATNRYRSDSKRYVWLVATGVAGVGTWFSFKWARDAAANSAGWRVAPVTLRDTRDRDLLGLGVWHPF